MNLRFWRRKPTGEEPEIKNVRNVGDIMISVTTGLHGTKDVKVSGWNQPMAEDLFWKVWDGLRERERE